MPYFAPPGGSLTAAFARTLLGLGVLPAGLRRPIFVHPAILAARMRAQMAAATSSGQAQMTGMGILPSVNVRYTRAVIPAGLALRAWRAAHPQTEIEGLGKIKAAAATLPGLMRQRGFFMGPGGGPSSGPFTLGPGFGLPQTRRLSFFGQDDLTPPDIPNPAIITNPNLPGLGPEEIPLPPTGNPPAVPMETVDRPVVGQIVPTSMVKVPQLVYQPGTPGVSIRYVPRSSFMETASIGVPNKWLIGVRTGILLLTMVRRRRRNPRRRRKSFQLIRATGSLRPNPAV